jgi:hypothetical protein
MRETYLKIKTQVWPPPALSTHPAAGWRNLERYLQKCHSSLTLARGRRRWMRVGEVRVGAGGGMTAAVFLP